MEYLEQQKCPYDGTLGILRDIKINRDFVLGTVVSVICRWECQKCHSCFETSIPYLEILYLGSKNEE